ncbi:hypothetical protein CDIK_2970 [Cucumispora dikerogammari]|nr:hypothetical protein CDIK_2970 [Cucumispora dikerogammari]
MLQIKHLEDENERENVFKNLIIDFVATKNISQITESMKHPLIKTEEQIKRYENIKKDYEIEKENEKLNLINLQNIKQLKESKLLTKDNNINKSKKLKVGSNVKRKDIIDSNIVNEEISNLRKNIKVETYRKGSDKRGIKKGIDENKKFIKKGIDENKSSIIKGRELEKDGVKNKQKNNKFAKNYAIKKLNYDKKPTKNRKRKR